MLESCVNWLREQQGSLGSFPGWGSDSCWCYTGGLLQTWETPDAVGLGITEAWEIQGQWKQLHILIWNYIVLLSVPYSLRFRCLILLCLNNELTLKTLFSPWKWRVTAIIWTFHCKTLLTQTRPAPVQIILLLLNSWSHASLRIQRPFS